VFFFVYLESRAICRYLETKYKGQGTELIPSKDAAAQGLFEQGVSIETSYFDSSAGGIVFERLFKSYVLVVFFIKIELNFFCLVRMVSVSQMKLV